MREGGSSHADLVLPSEPWPGSPLSSSPPGSGPQERRPSSPTGCASTEMENVKGTFLRSLTAKITTPAPISLLTQQLHLQIPTWVGFDRLVWF